MTYQDWRVNEWENLTILCDKLDTTMKKEMSSQTQQETVSWNTFLMLTGKKIDFWKRKNKKIRVFRKGGNVFVSDHEWIIGEIYKKDNMRAKVSHISAEGEAILNILDGGLKIITSTQPLEWRIA